MKVFSNSKIGTYQQCPRKFKLQYIDKIPIPKGAINVEALMGNCVHNSLRELYQKTNEGIITTLSDLQSFFSNQWNENIQEEIIIPKKGLTLEHFENNGLEMLKQYFNRYFPFNQSLSIALEKKVQFSLDEYEITGFIDRLALKNGNVYEIHDYKTSSSYPTITDIENDSQLSLYQIGVTSLYPNVEKVELIWHFLKFDSEISVTKTIEELDTIKQNTISWIRKILHDPYYPPNESPLCNWCLYEEFCPAKTHSAKISSYCSAELDSGMQIVDEYAKIQNQIFELNQRKTALEEILCEIEKKAIEFALEKQYTKLVGKNSSLQIKDEWDYQFPKSMEPGRVELENWLRNKDIWDQVSMLQLPKLSKLVKNEILPQEIHNELMGFSQMVHTKKVKLIKNKVDLLSDEISEND
jgi:putative RecB family exonuclease